MSSLFSCLTIAAVLLAVVPARAEREERVVYAISIGNNAPPVTHPELSALRFADDDAVRYHEVLRLASRHAELLTVLDRRTQERFPAMAERTRAPTLQAFEQALARVRSKMRADVEAGRRPVLFLTFSGHGAVDAQGEPFLAMADGNLTRTRLHEHVLPSLSDAQVHLLVDACHAEAAVGVRGLFDREASATTVALDDREAATLLQERTLDRFPNVGAIVATSSEQEAHEWARIESGVFTHEVLSALLGAADVNGDLRVEYSEVEAFVAAANRNVQDPRARPQIKAHAPRADQRAVLMDLHTLEHVALLRGRAGELGRFYVELDNGVRWLEAHLSGDVWATLALPLTRGSHVRTREREAAVPGKGAVLLSDLRFEPLRTAARGSVDEAYRTNLFAVPYGPSYYGGYVDSAGLLSVPFGGPRRSDEGPGERNERGKASAITLFSLAGGALVGSGVFAGLALHTRREFERATMRSARELSADYKLQTGLALGCAGLSVVAAGLGALVWPRASVALSADGRSVSASLTLHP